MSAADAAPKATAVAVAAELTAEGLQWMLLRTAVSALERAKNNSILCAATARGVTCDVWLNAYDAAPEAVRQTLTQSVMATAAGSTWAPAVRDGLTDAVLARERYVFGTPLRAFVTVCPSPYDRNAPLSDAALTRLFQGLQRVGFFAAADRHDLAAVLTRRAIEAPRAFELLIADSSADAALPGPTRCSAGDAHNPPRHHSVTRDDILEVTVHHVMSSVIAYSCDHDATALWRALTDVRLPFGARAMDEEWAHALTGPCGCAGPQRIAADLLSRASLYSAILADFDEAGEWLALRLPPNRLNERDDGGATPLIAALGSTAMLRTVAALLSRVPDVDLTLRARLYDGTDRECTAAERLNTRKAPQWLPPHLAAELKLKTEQFGAQYLPSAAVLCAETLCGGSGGAVSGAVSGAVGLPRELVSLVLQYTALPQPNPWPNAVNAHAIARIEPDVAARGPATAFDAVPSVSSA